MVKSELTKMANPTFDRAAGVVASAQKTDWGVLGQRQIAVDRTRQFVQGNTRYSLRYWSTAQQDTSGFSVKKYVQKQGGIPTFEGSLEFTHTKGADAASEKDTLMFGLLSGSAIVLERSYHGSILPTNETVQNAEVKFRQAETFFGDALGALESALRQPGSWADIVV